MKTLTFGKPFSRFEDPEWPGVAFTVFALFTSVEAVLHDCVPCRTTLRIDTSGTPDWGPRVRPAGPIGDARREAREKYR